MPDWERIGRAVLHPLQLRALQAIEESENPRSPGELAREFGEKVNTVSYHVRRLAHLGMIELAHTKQRRGAIEHFYRLADATEDDRA